MMFGSQNYIRFFIFGNLKIYFKHSLRLLSGKKTIYFWGSLIPEKHVSLRSHTFSSRSETTTKHTCNIPANGLTELDSDSQFLRTNSALRYRPRIKVNIGFVKFLTMKQQYVEVHWQT